MRLTLKAVSASWLDKEDAAGATAHGYSGVTAQEGQENSEEQGIEMQAVEENSDDDVLKEVDLDVKEGELVVVVGPVGCSKTSLLMAIMGELHIRQGSIEISGEAGMGQIALHRGDVFADGKVPEGASTFAYAAQEPGL